MSNKESFFSLSKEKRSIEAEEKNDLRFKFTCIDNFSGSYEFLSLDYKCDIFFKNKIFPSAFHAVVAAKYEESEFSVEEILKTPNPKALKNLIENKNQSCDWVRFRLKWMEQIQRDKFRRNSDLREKLMLTGKRELVWNNKNDVFFGKIQQKGQNYLGRILKEIRQNIADDTELDSWLVICNEIEIDSNIRPKIILTESKDEVDEKTHNLEKKAYYRIGKLPDNDVQALNPSISRRHALITVNKGGRVMLIDLKSKSGTYKNGEKILLDHVGVELTSGDKIRFGTSRRQYTINIDRLGILSYYEKKQRELQRQIERLDVDIGDPLGIKTKNLNKVFVASLPYKTTIEDLREYFRYCGEITDIHLLQNKNKSSSKELRNDDETCASRGMAFITFADHGGARHALDKNGRSLNGRNIKVSYADLQKHERLMIDGKVVAEEGGAAHTKNSGSIKSGLSSFPVEFVRGREKRGRWDSDARNGLECESFFERKREKSNSLRKQRDVSRRSSSALEDNANTDHEEIHSKDKRSDKTSRSSTSTNKGNDRRGRSRNSYARCRKSRSSNSEVEEKYTKAIKKSSMVSRRSVSIYSDTNASRNYNGYRTHSSKKSYSRRKSKSASKKGNRDQERKIYMKKRRKRSISSEVSNSYTDSSADKKNRTQRDNEFDTSH